MSIKKQDLVDWIKPHWVRPFWPLIAVGNAIVGMCVIAAVAIWTERNQFRWLLSVSWQLATYQVTDEPTDNGSEV